MIVINPILTNLTAALLLLVFAVLPAYYINKFLIRLVRPKESVWRLLAHITILLATAILYTSLIVVILVRYVFHPS